jgi:hypothetical protein
MKLVLEGTKYKMVVLCEGMMADDVGMFRLLLLLPTAAL